MPKLTCDCGTERFFTVSDLRAAAGQPYQCPSCGKVRKLPLMPAAQPAQSAEQSSGPAAAEVDLGELFAEIEAVDQSVPPPVPLSALAAAVQQEMNQESGMLFLELWANVAVVVCYLLSAGAIVYGIVIFKRADSVTSEIFAAVCWMFALLALIGGCSIQILLEICRRVNSAKDIARPWAATNERKNHG
jgi:hypothetical protein